MNCYLKSNFREYTSLAKILKNFPRYLRARHPKLYTEIENMMIEIYMASRVSSDEKFLGCLNTVLNFS